MNEDSTTGPNGDEAVLALLRAELDASFFGNLGRGRPIAAWFWARRQALAAMLDTANPMLDWAAVARALAKAGLRDEAGDPPTASMCREAWRRVERRARSLAQGATEAQPKEAPHGVVDGRRALRPPAALPEHNSAAAPGAARAMRSSRAAAARALRVPTGLADPPALPAQDFWRKRSS